MPYKSKSQMRKFFAKERRGELPEGTARRWAHETPKLKSLPEKKAMLIEKVAKKTTKALHPREPIYGIEGPSKEYVKGRIEYVAKPPGIFVSPSKAMQKWEDNADKTLDKKLVEAENPYKAYGVIEERAEYFPGKLKSRHEKAKEILDQSGVRKDIIKARKLDPSKKLDEEETRLGFASLGAFGVLMAMEVALRDSPEAAEQFAKEIIAGGKTGLKEVKMSKAPIAGIPLGKIRIPFINPKSGEVLILKKPNILNMILGGPYYARSDSALDKVISKAFGTKDGARGHIVSTPNLGVLSHELGHAKNRQWVSRTFGAPGRIAHTVAYMDLGALPIIGGRIPRPIRNLPVIGLAALPLFSEGFTKKMKGKDKDSLRYKIFDKIEKNPEILGTALLFPKLIEEAAATAHGLDMVHKWGAKKGKGLVEIGKALAVTIPAFATYVLVAGGGYAALRALGKFRRAEGPEKMKKITRQHEKAMEKMKKLVK